MKERTSIRNVHWAMLSACLLFVSMHDAQAYLDPVSSSYFFQIIIAGLTAFVFLFSTIKNRLLRFLGKKKDGARMEKNPAEKQSAPDSENTPDSR